MTTDGAADQVTKCCFSKDKLTITLTCFNLHFTGIIGRVDALNVLTVIYNHICISMLHSRYSYLYFKNHKLWPTLRYVEELTLASLLLIFLLIIFKQT